MCGQAKLYATLCYFTRYIHCICCHSCCAIHSFASLFVLATMQRCMHNLLVLLQEPPLCSAVLYVSFTTLCDLFADVVICLPTFYAYLSHGIVVIVVILTFVNFYASLPYCHSCIFALLIRTYALAFRFFSLSLSLALPLHLSLLSLYIAIKMQ